MTETVTINVETEVDVEISEAVCSFCGGELNVTATTGIGAQTIELAVDPCTTCADLGERRGYKR